jgi:hypothetical protein
MYRVTIGSVATISVRASRREDRSAELWDR